MHLFTLTRNPQALAFHVGVVSSKFYSKIVHERIARFPEGDPSTSGHVKGSQSSCRTACDTPFLLISHLTFGSQIRKGMMMRACSHNSRECCWMSHPLLVPLISRLRRWLHLGSRYDGTQYYSQVSFSMWLELIISPVKRFTNSTPMLNFLNIHVCFSPNSVLRCTES